MESMRSASFRRVAAPPAVRLGRHAVLTFLLLQFSAAAFLVWRAFSRSIGPLDGVTVLVAATLLAGAAAVVRLAWHIANARRPPGLASRLVDWGAPAVLLVLGVCLSLRCSSPPAVLTMWLLFISAELLAWRWRRRFQRTPAARHSAVATPARPATASIEPAPAGGEVTAPPAAGLETGESAESVLPPGVSQQLTRRMSAEGVDEMVGLVRCPLASGQRQQTLHVAFCPPFAVTPEMACEQSAGAEAQVQIGQVHTFGSRLDVRLQRTAASDTDVLIRFTARCSS